MIEHFKRYTCDDCRAVVQGVEFPKGWKAVVLPPGTYDRYGHRNNHTTQNSFRFHLCERCHPKRRKPSGESTRRWSGAALTEILFMRESRGLTYKEMGEIFGVSPSRMREVAGKAYMRARREQRETDK